MLRVDDVSFGYLTRPLLIAADVLLLVADKGKGDEVSEEDGEEEDEEDRGGHDVAVTADAAGIVTEAWNDMKKKRKDE